MTGGRAGGVPPLDPGPGDGRIPSRAGPVPNGSWGRRPYTAPMGWTKPGPVRLYVDGRCGMCQRFRRLVEALDTGDRVEGVALQDAHREGEHLGLPEDAFWSRFHVELPDGSVRSGVDAIAPLLARLPAAVPAAWAVAHLPPARLIAAGLYRVALARHGGPAEPWSGDEGGT